MVAVASDYNMVFAKCNRLTSSFWPDLYPSVLLTFPSEQDLAISGRIKVDKDRGISNGNYLWFLFLPSL